MEIFDTNGMRSGRKEFVIRLTTGKSLENTGFDATSLIGSEHRDN